MIEYLKRGKGFFLCKAASPEQILLKYGEIEYLFWILIYLQSRYVLLFRQYIARSLLIRVTFWWNQEGSGYARQVENHVCFLLPLKDFLRSFAMNCNRLSFLHVSLHFSRICLFWSFSAPVQLDSRSILIAPALNASVGQLGPAAIRAATQDPIKLGSAMRPQTPSNTWG